MRIHHHAPPIRRHLRRHDIRTARYHLAVAVIVLFGCVCLGPIAAPDRVPFEKLLLFVAAPLMLVLSYYFGRRGMQ